MDPTIDFRHDAYDKSQDFSLSENNQTSQSSRPPGVGHSTRGKGKGGRNHGNWGKNNYGWQPAHNYSHYYGAETCAAANYSQRSGHPILPAGKGATVVAKSEPPPRFVAHPTLLVIVDHPPEPCALSQFEKDWNCWGLRSRSNPADGSTAPEQDVGDDNDSNKNEESTEHELQEKQIEYDKDLQWRYYYLELQTLQERSYKHVEHKELYLVTMATRQIPGRFLVPKPINVPQYRGETTAVFGVRNILQRCAGPLHQQLKVVLGLQKGPQFVELKLKLGKVLVVNDPATSQTRIQGQPLVLRNFLFLYKSGLITTMFDPSLAEDYRTSLEANLVQLDGRSTTKFMKVVDNEEIWDVSVNEERNSKGRYRLLLERIPGAQGGQLRLLRASYQPTKYYICDMISCHGQPYDEESSELASQVICEGNEERRKKYEQQLEEYEKALEAQNAWDTERQRLVEAALAEGVEMQPMPSRPKVPPEPWKPKDKRCMGAVYERPEVPEPGLRLSLTSALLIRNLSQEEQEKSVSAAEQARLYHALEEYVSNMSANPNGVLLATFGRFRMMTWRRKVRTIWKNSNVQVAVSEVRQDSHNDLDWQKVEVDFSCPKWEDFFRNTAGEASSWKPADIIAPLAKFMDDAYFVATGRPGDLGQDADDFATKCAAEWVDVHIEEPKRRAEAQKEAARSNEQATQTRLEANGFYNLYQYSDDDETVAAIEDIPT